MRWSETLIPTLRERPKEAKISSHELMLRAGLMRQLGAGLYTYLPLGLRVIKKVERIIREEMNRKGAQELLMPILQPRELWEASGRWERAAEELGMMKLKIREEKEFVLGPTHEEVITDLVKREIRSYKDLPRNFYQIQTKFRDELRPRFGVIRAKEFIMKDAYSFDVDEESSKRSYDNMYDAYSKIFERCGLITLAVEADPGAMGGTTSHEFMVLADNGEDLLLYCRKCKYAANRERAERRIPELRRRKSEQRPLEEIETPNITKVEELEGFLKEKLERMVKTLIYITDKGNIAALIQGDRELNEVKLKRILGVKELTMADGRLIQDITGGPMGFSGPVGLKEIRMIADPGVVNIVNGITGANKKDRHLRNVNIDRDYKVDDIQDLTYVKEGDSCPRCSQPLQLNRGIEVGQVFYLGRDYSQSLGAKFLDKDGKERAAVMGCYGIGITRTIAAVVETNHDEKGIIWPLGISPYQVLLLPVEIEDKGVRDEAERIYSELQHEGMEILYDDRLERAGVKFKDADLIGIPVQLIVSKKRIAQGKVELKIRRTGKEILADKAEAIPEVKRLT